MWKYSRYFPNVPTGASCALRLESHAARNPRYHLTSAPRDGGRARRHVTDGNPASCRRGDALRKATGSPAQGGMLSNIVNRCIQTLRGLPARITYDHEAGWWGTIASRCLTRAAPEWFWPHLPSGGLSIAGPCIQGVMPQSQRSDQAGSEDSCGI
jgi:hypothetical protein